MDQYVNLSLTCMLKLPTNNANLTIKSTEIYKYIHKYISNKIITLLIDM